MTLVKTLQYDVNTKEMIETEVEMELPNPRIMEIQNRMTEILSLLKESDYKTMKYIEGSLTDEEFAAYKTEREALRAEYNSLEEELKTYALVV